jgi:hypothetical protein
MKRTPPINKAIALIRAGLAERLGKQGFQVVFSKDEDDLYASYYAIWSNDREMIKLTWNGLENVFQLDTSGELPLTSDTRWETLGMTAFDISREEPDYLQSIAGRMIQSLT